MSLGYLPWPCGQDYHWHICLGLSAQNVLSVIPQFLWDKNTPPASLSVTIPLHGRMQSSQMQRCWREHILIIQKKPGLKHLEVPTLTFWWGLQSAKCVLTPPRDRPMGLGTMCGRGRDNPMLCLLSCGRNCFRFPHVTLVDKVAAQHHNYTTTPQRQHNTLRSKEPSAGLCH